MKVISYIMKDIFHLTENHYNLRNNSTLKRKCTETIFSLVSKICQFVPNLIKDSTSLKLFKKEFKLWAIEKCLCRHCKKYLSNVVFV